MIGVATVGIGADFANFRKEVTAGVESTFPILEELKAEIAAAFDVGGLNLGAANVGGAAAMTAEVGAAGREAGAAYSEGFSTMVEDGFRTLDWAMMENTQATIGAIETEMRAAAATIATETSAAVDAGFAGGAGKARAAGVAEGEGFFGGFRGVAAGSKGFGSITELLGAGVVYESLKMAGSFQAAMTRVSSLAQVPVSSIKSLSDAVLNLSGQVGYGPTNLAEALYHVESNMSGMVGAGKLFANQAMEQAAAENALRVAAEGAQIGHADLIDVTNALGAVIATGTVKTEDYSSAMQVLLRTVGAGDMTMQNLANAMSTGIVAITSTYGVKLKDVGAALAVFGDNNIRGSDAATKLRMTVQDLGAQSTKGTKILELFGIQSGQLARDMRTGGLVSAIGDLRKHFIDAGLSTNEFGGVLTQIFTKRGGQGLSVLLTQFDRLLGKEKDIGNSTGSLSDLWKQRLGTMSQAVDNVKGTVEAWLTRLGTDIMPIATKALNGLNTGFQWLGAHPEVANVLKAVAVGIGAVAIALGVVATVSAVFDPVILAGAALGAVIYELWTKSKTFHEILAQVASVISTQFLPPLREIWNTIANQLAPAFVSFGHAIAPLAAILGRLFGAWLVVEIKAALDIIEGGIKVITGVLDVISGILTGNWSQVWSGLGDIVQGAWDMIRGIFLNSMAGLISVVVTFGAQIAAPFVALWHGIENVARSAWNGIMTAFHAFWSTMTGAVTGGMRIISTVFSTAWNALVSIVSFQFHAIVDVVALGIGLLILPFRVAYGVLVGIFTGNWATLNSITSNAMQGIEQIIQGVWNKIVSITMSVWNVIKSVLVGIWNGIRTAAVTVFNAIKSAISSSFSAAESIASSTWHAIESIITGAISSAWHAIEATLTAIKNGVSTAFTWLVSHFTSLPGMLFNAVESGLGQMAQIGVDVVHGIWNGLSSMTGWIVGKISSWASSIIPGPIKKVLGILSPSTVMRDQVGVWIPAGIVQGILKGAKGVESTMISLGKTMLSHGETGAAQLVEAYNRRLAPLGRALDSVGTKLKSAQADLNKQMTEAAAYSSKIAQQYMSNPLTTGPMGSAMNGQDIIGNLQSQLTSANQMAADIKKLQALHLNSTTLDQIIQSGNTSLAESLIGGGPGQVSAINALQTSLGKAAQSLGDTASTAMYGAGEKATEGLIKSLQTKQSQIKAEMTKIANSMITAIGRAIDAEIGRIPHGLATLGPYEKIQREKAIKAGTKVAHHKTVHVHIHASKAKDYLSLAQFLQAIGDAENVARTTARSGGTSS